eukprot:scaffold4291_cov256-Pinguiococcus_pyrenoidosus.AAC.4
MIVADRRHVFSVLWQGAREAHGDAHGTAFRVHLRVVVEKLHRQGVPHLHRGDAEREAVLQGQRQILKVHPQHDHLVKIGQEEAILQPATLHEVRDDLHEVDASIRRVRIVPEALLGEDLDVIRRRGDARRDQRLDIVREALAQVRQIPGLQRRGQAHWEVAASATGPPRDLLDVAAIDLDVLQAVPLRHRVQDDATDVQIEAHADGVRGDEDVEAAVRRVEALRLRRPRLGRQVAVHHRALVAGASLDLCADLIDALDRKRHHGVPRHDVVVALQGLLLHLQGRQAFVLAQFEVVARLLNQGAHQGLRLHPAAEMHLSGLQAQQGPCPRMASAGVADHLDLVQHGHVVALAHVQHLHGPGRMPGERQLVALLAGHQTAVNALRIGVFRHLQGQKPQRTEVHSASESPGGRPKATKCMVRLAAVGGASVEHNAALPKPRKRVPGVWRSEISVALQSSAALSPPERCHRPLPTQSHPCTPWMAAMQRPKADGTAQTTHFLSALFAVWKRKRKT